MRTEAIVYVEENDQTVHIDFDGIPSSMIPTLNRIIKEGLLDAFTSHDRYSSLAPNQESYRESVYFYEEMERQYVKVSNVGFDYPLPGRHSPAYSTYAYEISLNREISYKEVTGKLPE